MENEIIRNIAEFGIGIFAVGALGYILYTFISAHKKELNESRQERQKNQQWFMSYVNENNHQKAEMIKEHTEATVSAKEAIERHTGVIEKLVNRVENISFHNFRKDHEK